MIVTMKVLTPRHHHCYSTLNFKFMYLACRQHAGTSQTGMFILAPWNTYNHHYSFPWQNTMVSVLQIHMPCEVCCLRSYWKSLFSSRKAPVHHIRCMAHSYGYCIYWTTFKYTPLHVRCWCARYISLEYFTFSYLRTIGSECSMCVE